MWTAKTVRVNTICASAILRGRAEVEGRGGGAQKM